MKIAENFLVDGDKLIHARTFDNQPALDQAQEMRSAGVGMTGENLLVARIPMNLITDWLQEAGVRWDDPASKEVIKRKLISGEASKLRVWEGNY